MIGLRIESLKTPSQQCLPSLLTNARVSLCMPAKPKPPSEKRRRAKAKAKARVPSSHDPNTPSSLANSISQTANEKRRPRMCLPRKQGGIAKEMRAKEYEGVRVAGSGPKENSKPVASSRFAIQQVSCAAMREQQVVCVCVVSCSVWSS